MNGTIHICLISDANYARQLLVSLASILAAAAPEDVLVFHIVDGGLDDSARRGIDKLKRIKPFVCRYLKAGATELARFPRHRCAPCAYYRVMLPRLLPDLDKLIYLDCDLIVLQSLRELWNADLAGRSVAAAPDFIDYVKDELPNIKHLTGFGFNPRHCYFNSGVMLLNLEKMRARHFEEIFLEARRKLDARIRFSDQDIYNYLFQRDQLILPQGWNYQANMGLLPAGRLDFDTLELKIIHYTTEVKPWGPALCMFKREYQAVEALLEAVLA